jgi:hypothetical protein
VVRGERVTVRCLLSLVILSLFRFCYVMSPPRVSSKFVVLALTGVSFLSLFFSLSARVRVTELQREFADKHGATVDSVARPYAFIKFDTFIQKTKKLYSDQRTQRNLEKLNEDLHDIQSIMTRNINDVLEQGERLDRVENMSGNLAMESKKYAKKAKDLSRQALIQKYMPVIVLVGLFIFVYGFRRFFAAA